MIVEKTWIVQLKCLVEVFLTNVVPGRVLGEETARLQPGARWRSVQTGEDRSVSSHPQAGYQAQAGALYEVSYL